jgi:hypothetical protein
MLNRQTGEGIVGTVWADEVSLDAAAELPRRVGSGRRSKG